MAEVVISAIGLGKRYKLFNGGRGRLRHLLWPDKASRPDEIWALRGVSFEVRRGETFAIIGKNGSGKSTLLELLAGVSKPTEGEIHVHGRVSALLELGSGFSPEYSGRDNVMLNGLLLGLSRAEILRRFPEIEAFAEVGAAIDRPVKTYSSGMVMRLAFAVQVLCDPDILVIDEALSVGDFFFQQKCLGHIRELCARGVTLIFVSHDMGVVRDLCSRALYLSRGSEVFQGDALKAISAFMSEQGPAGGAGSPAPAQPDRAGQPHLPELPGAATWQRALGAGLPLLAVSVQDGGGSPVTHIRMAAPLRVRVYFQAGFDPRGCIALFVKNRFDQVVTVTTSSRLGFETCCTGPDGYGVFDFDFDCMLESGLYSMRVTFFRHVKPNQGEELDGTSWFGPLQVDWDYETEMAPFLGLFGLPVRGSLHRIQQGAGHE